MSETPRFDKVNARVGDLIEIMSDALTDKAPATGQIFAWEGDNPVIKWGVLPRAHHASGPLKGKLAHPALNDIQLIDADRIRSYVIEFVENNHAGKRLWIVTREAVKPEPVDGDAEST